MRNLLGTVPSPSKDMVAATVRTIFAQPDAATTRSQLHDVVGLLAERFPKAAELLAAAEADVCAYASFPRAHWRKIASTNPLERVNKEIKRRSNVVGIFPDDASVIRRSVTAQSSCCSRKTAPTSQGGRVARAATSCVRLRTSSLRNT